MQHSLQSSEVRRLQRLVDAGEMSDPEVTQIEMPVDSTAIVKTDPLCARPPQAGFLRRMIAWLWVRRQAEPDSGSSGR